MSERNSETDMEEDTETDTGDDESPGSSFPLSASTGLTAVQFGLIGVFTAVLWYATESVIISVIGGVAFGIITIAVVTYLLIRYAAGKLQDSMGIDILN